MDDYNNNYNNNYDPFDGPDEEPKTSVLGHEDSGYASAPNGAPNAYGQPNYNQPNYNQPNYNQPNYNQPNYNQPNYNQPNYNQPNYNQPNYNQPNYNQPNYNQPNYNQPNYNQPNYNQPPYGQPNYDQQGYINRGPVYGQVNMDPGAKEASSCKTFGILSIFIFGLIFGCVALGKYNTYKQIGDGSHMSDANTGRICGIIGIVLHVISLISSFVLNIVLNS